MMKRFYLAVKRRDMRDYAQHTPLMECDSVEEFLDLPLIKREVFIGKQFKDEMRVMEDNPNPAGGNWIRKEL
jgi:hypothetical protein